MKITHLLFGAIRALFCLLSIGSSSLASAQSVKYIRNRPDRTGDSGKDRSHRSSDHLRTQRPTPKVIGASTLDHSYDINELVEKIKRDQAKRSKETAERKTAREEASEKALMN